MDKQKLIRRIPFLLIPIYFIIDIVTKLIVVNNLPYQKYVPVFGNVVGFTYIFNKGAAFGLFAKMNPLLKNIIFTIITSFAIVFIFYLMLKAYRGKKLSMHACGLILGGAFGNVADRILGYMIYGDINIHTGVNLGRKFKFFFSKVVDFVNIGWGNPYGHSGGWRWPYFNFADACITIGLVILVFTVLFTKEPQKEKKEKLEEN